MSYTMEELRTRLANGESVDTIANEMTAMLNNAVTALETEKANSQKRADWNDVFNAIFYLMKKHYPKTTKYFTDLDWTEAEKNELLNGIIAAVDETEKEVDALSAMLPVIFSARSTKKSATNDDDILNKWIKSIS